MKKLFKFYVLAVLLGVPGLLIADEIHEATLLGDLARVQRLVESGADVNAQSNGGMAPLHIAANKGDTKIAQLLINRGAKVNAKTYNGWTSLHWAEKNGSAEMVELLIKNGADVNAQSNTDFTPLHFAVSHRKIEIVRLLLRYGADMNIKTIDGTTPFDLASNISKMAKIFEEFKKHNRMLWNAVCGRNAKVAIIALDKGAQPNATATEDMISKRGDAPAGVAECVRGAAKRGDTPMHIAVEKGNVGMAVMLSGFGGRFDIKNKSGDTAWDFAIKDPAGQQIIELTHERKQEKQETD